MFYIPLAILTWILAPRLLDRSRLPELSLYALVAAALATVHDRFVLLYQLWEYRDTGFINTHAEIAFLISLSAAPVFGMRFAQHLVPGAPPPWLRMARFTAFAMLPELVALYTGNIAYHQWWNAGWSVAAYLPIWLSLWAFHRWLSQPKQAPESASQEVGLVE